MKSEKEINNNQGEITEEMIEDSFKNAKAWCREHLQELTVSEDSFEVERFQYTIDNKMIGYDITVDPDRNHLLKVSMRKINWLNEREKKYPTGVEVDPESMFVYMFAYLGIEASLPLGYASRAMETIRKEARFTENMNRLQRGLKPNIEP